MIEENYKSGGLLKSKGWVAGVGGHNGLMGHSMGEWIAWKGRLVGGLMFPGFGAWLLNALTVEMVSIWLDGLDTYPYQVCSMHTTN